MRGGGGDRRRWRLATCRPWTRVLTTPWPTMTSTSMRRRLCPPTAVTPLTLPRLIRATVLQRPHMELQPLILPHHMELQPLILPHLMELQPLILPHYMELLRLVTMPQSR